MPGRFVAEARSKTRRVLLLGEPGVIIGVGGRLSGGEGGGCRSPCFQKHAAGETADIEPRTEVGFVWMGREAM